MNSWEMIEKKVFSYIEEHRMIAPHDKIVAGVSGGADSVCLLFLLLEYAKKVPLTLAVVHVNHGIRPDAARDAQYVEELCRENYIPFFLTEADVHKKAREEKCSQEAAGRKIRYEAFYRAAEKMNAAAAGAADGAGTADGAGAGVGASPKIAVAHNSNDNAETMLFHLFRGSGLKGLCGIAPVREADGTQGSVQNKTAGAREFAKDGGTIIRPLLCLERQEIEDYLRGRGLNWCTDSTNSGDDYTRNRIRHHILPYAEQEIAAGTVGHMSRTAELLRETEDFLEQQTREALEKCLVRAQTGPEPCRERSSGHSPESGKEIRCAAFLENHIVLQKRMLLTLAKQLSPTGKDISRVHIQDLLSLFAKEGNRSIHLPYGIIARRQYDKVILEREAADAAEWDGLTIPISEKLFETPFICELPDCYAGENRPPEPVKLEISAFLLKKSREVPRNQCTKWFDYDKMEESMIVRFRRTGDYFTIADGAGNCVHKSLKDYMITEKIPKQLRDRIPLIAVGNHVLWLIGRRISEQFKCSGNTNRVLQVKIISDDCQGSETEEKNVRKH